MKKILLLLFTLAVFVQVYAQPGGSRRRDTLFGDNPHAPYLNSVYRADVLEGRTTSIAITPAGQKICFDKKIKIKTVTSRGMAEICVFLNTKIGLIGYTPLKPGGDPVCDIKAELSDFRFSIISLKGNVYNYINNKKKGEIEHWVQTSNSDHYLYDFGGLPSSAQLRKKAERREYCDGKVRAQLYKVDGQPQEWFLFGKNYPEAITMESKKFLGQFAVGYQYSDKGLFIVMQMTAAAIDSKIIQLEEVNICFDPAPFKVMEDVRQTKMTTEIARERQKIAKEESKQEKYPACQSKKMVMLNYQKEALNKREQNVQKANEGNSMQQAATQQAQADLFSYDENIQLMIYETELNICRAQQRQAESPSETTQQKIVCLQEVLVIQKQTQVKFQQINTQYKNQPGKQVAEKSKAMMQAVRLCN